MGNELDPTTDDLQQELCNLITQLSSPVSPIGDWKIAKYNEYILSDNPAPYDIDELHTKRQVVRDRINEIQEILSKNNA